MRLKLFILSIVCLAFFTSCKKESCPTCTENFECVDDKCTCPEDLAQIGEKCLTLFENEYKTVSASKDCGLCDLENTLIGLDPEELKQGNFSIRTDQNSAVFTGVISYFEREAGDSIKIRPFYYDVNPPDCQHNGESIIMEGYGVFSPDKSTFSLSLNYRLINDTSSLGTCTVQFSN